MAQPLLVMTACVLMWQEGAFGCHSGCVGCYVISAHNDATFTISDRMHSDVAGMCLCLAILGVVIVTTYLPTMTQPYFS